ncbi:hypothetical protein KC842_00335 [Candidatus Nomurabacteria bacterium]|nr:hypothetical protein [Candidatus Nomurabacteria bacterium]USN94828.1 MAG: hypothetical protein H6791_00120 [Candidatus Nomurabacteria bacterium]
MIINTYKKEGETPLECILRLRQEGTITENEKATYAGRLDPMAEGVLVILSGQDVHQKEEYLKLDKEYEVDILFGVSTDTGDVLGIIQNSKFKSQNNFISFSAIAEDNIKAALSKCIGSFEEEYPVYSSRTVSGKPLFSLARLGQIFHTPKHKVTIHSIILNNVITRNGKDIAEESIQRIAKVKGDFRQNEIISLWEKFADEYKAEDLQIIKIKVSCASGAYMRVLAEKIGKDLGTPSLAYRIKRTRVGEYKT